MGFVVTFWTCEGMRTEICEAAENSGEEIFRTLRDHFGTSLIFELFNDRT